MTSEFFNRLEDAKKIVAKQRVKKYIIDKKIEKWVVVGNSREYLVNLNPFWCRCYDFQNNVLSGHVSQCKHNIAVQIAIREGNFDSYSLSKEEYDQIRSDFLFD
ncbi:MAG: hypothetical protein ACFFAU_14990 [Candidatus Hodarchaeota archaeon]